MIGMPTRRYCTKPENRRYLQSIRVLEDFMDRRLLPLFMLLAFAACDTLTTSEHISEFWRPISEPNLLLPLDQAQKKLDFDISQCHCGIFPANMSHADAVGFQPDQQQLAATAVTVTPDQDSGQCLQQPSLVVSECMRARGWEVTNCSGRMPLPGGGSLCTSYSTSTSSTTIQ
jgi:hypothetical protein